MIEVHFKQSQFQTSRSKRKFDLAVFKYFLNYSHPSILVIICEKKDITTMKIRQIMIRHDQYSKFANLCGIDLQLITKTGGKWQSATY